MWLRESEPYKKELLHILFFSFIQMYINYAIILMKAQLHVLLFNSKNVARQKSEKKMNELIQVHGKI